MFGQLININCVVKFIIKNKILKFHHNFNKLMETKFIYSASAKI